MLSRKARFSKLIMALPTRVRHVSTATDAQDNARKAIERSGFKSSEQALQHAARRTPGFAHGRGANAASPVVAPRVPCETMLCVHGPISMHRMVRRVLLSVPTTKRIATYVQRLSPSRCGGRSELRKAIVRKQAI